MEKFLNLVRSNNMVQAVLCIAFGLFLMIYPSITVQGIILLFGVALAVMGAAGLVSYFRQRSVRYRDSGTLMSAVFYVIIALIAFIFPKVIAGFFSVVLGVVLILLAIVNVVRAFGLRAFGSGIWIAVLATAVLVGIGGVLIVVNPWGASMTFVLVLGATFIVNGAVDLFIEWYTRDSEKKAGGDFAPVDVSAAGRAPRGTARPWAAPAPCGVANRAGRDRLHPRRRRVGHALRFCRCLPIKGFYIRFPLRPPCGRGSLLS